MVLCEQKKSKNKKEAEFGLWNPNYIINSYNILSVFYQIVLQIYLIYNILFITKKTTLFIILIFIVLKNHII